MIRTGVAGPFDAIPAAGAQGVSHLAFARDPPCTDIDRHFEDRIALSRARIKRGEGEALPLHGVLSLLVGLT
jgi:hypothetical protein